MTRHLQAVEPTVADYAEMADAFAQMDIDEANHELAEDAFDEYDEYDEYDGQPDELTEWLDFDPDC